MLRTVRVEERDQRGEVVREFPFEVDDQHLTSKTKKNFEAFIALNYHTRGMVEAVTGFPRLPGNMQVYEEDGRKLLSQERYNTLVMIYHGMVVRRHASALLRYGIKVIA